MGKIWILMLLSSISVLMFTEPNLALESMLKGANSSISLAIELLAMYGFWLGFFAILEKSGISNIIAKLLSPLIRFLFKGSSDEARQFISMNMAANLIGLGNAATPMGISAIKALDTGTKKANTNMIMLIVISSTSLQLLPSTVIGLRARHGSIDAGNFLFPCLVATISSTLIGIFLVKLLSKIFKDEKAEKTEKIKERKELTLCLNT